MMMKSVIVSIPAMKTSIKTLSLYTTYSTVPAGIVQLGRRDSAYKGVPPSPPLTLYPHADLAFIIHHTLTKLSAGKKNDTTKPIHSWFGFWHHLTNGKCICFRACAAFFFFFFFFLGVVKYYLQLSRSTGQYRGVIPVFNGLWRL